MFDSPLSDYLEWTSTRVDRSMFTFVFKVNNRTEQSQTAASILLQSSKVKEVKEGCSTFPAACCLARSFLRFKNIEQNVISVHLSYVLACIYELLCYVMLELLLLQHC